jgi:hypothetical protein
VFGWFRRKNKKTDAAKDAESPVPADEGVVRAVPSWSSFGTVAEYRRFLQLVREYFAAQGRTVVINDGVVYGAESGEKRLGLQNLAQVCHQAPPDDWPDMIAEHFTAMQESERFGKEWEARHADYAWAKQRLMLRLQPKEYLEALGDAKIVHRVDLPETVTMLVADFPTSTMSIDRETLAKWDVPLEQVFADAMANVVRFTEPEWGELDPGDDSPVTLRVLSGEGYYSTTHVLRLHEWPDQIGEHGTLIAVGNRGGALVYPIASAESFAALQMMIPIAVGTYRDGPGSISPHIYWRKPDSTFDLQRTTIEEGKLVFTPSREFTALMEKLADS